MAWNRLDTPLDSDPLGLTLDFHLLGVVRFHRVLELQERLVAAAAAGRARSLPILLCEHPSLITIGRSGSRADIRLTNDQLQRRSLAIEWVARGGGCVQHVPGQLCIYPIVPLREVGWTVGEYLRRLRQGLIESIARLKLSAVQRPGTCGVWGQLGLVAAIGVKVQDWIAHHGAFLNVHPDMSLFGYIDTASGEKQSTMSCLLAERRGAVNMSSVRTSMIECLAAAFGAERYHIHAGHPWLATEFDGVRGSRESA